MSSSNEDLLRLILDTKALSIWNREKGPVFWYAAGVPGPFFVNTELMIGPALAKDMLEKITNIVAATNDPASRADQLDELILPAYEKNDGYRKVIDALVAAARKELTDTKFTCVSGGERRDWIFSIPFAKLYGLDHVYLFKNKSLFCRRKLTESEPALHVSDLINNAASYFDAWLPALSQAKLTCPATLCVNSRGSVGVQRLIDDGRKVVAVNSIDAGFFENLHASNLITAETLEEMKVFLGSYKDWASKYLFNNTDLLPLFNIGNISGKELDRAQAFFEKDPWELKNKHAEFFATALDAIAARKKAA